MKKLLVLMLALGIAIVGLSGLSPARADDTESFTITITIGYIDIALKTYGGGDYTNWDIGTADLSSVNTMATMEGIHIDNSSNRQIDLDSYASSPSWAIVDTGTPGSDEFKLEAKGFSTWEATGPNMTGAIALDSETVGKEIDPDIGALTDRVWYYRLTAPSAVSSYDPETITVYIVATAG